MLPVGTIDDIRVVFDVLRYSFTVLWGSVLRNPLSKLRGERSPSEIESLAACFAAERVP